MRVMAFQRARSEEQREIRRQAILDTAAAMLDVMPVSEVSLNELSRRAGLAKSNVLRYFESREAILLELLDRATKLWLSELPGQLAAGMAARRHAPGSAPTSLPSFSRARSRPGGNCATCSAPRPASLSTMSRPR